MADASKEGGNSFEEWKEVRGIFTRFDGYLNDLRKYGFTVIAALLTATSIEAMLNLDESARFALLILTCAFITALHLFDHNYRQYEKAASKRAKILEPMLNPTIRSKNRTPIIIIQPKDLCTMSLKSKICQ